MPFCGRCLCGAVTYFVDGDPLTTLTCHCDVCQRLSGSPFSVNVVVPRDALSVDGDTVKTFETTGEETGEKRQRQFCSVCGSTLFSFAAEAPAIVLIKAGTLDDRSTVSPQIELWCDSKQPWLERDQPTRTFPTGLPG